MRRKPFTSEQSLVPALSNQKRIDWERFKYDVFFETYYDINDRITARKLSLNQFITKME